MIGEIWIYLSLLNGQPYQNLGEFCSVDFDKHDKNISRLSADVKIGLHANRFSACV